MKNLKKLISVVLVLCMALSLIACSPKKAPSDEIEAAIQSAGKYLVKNTVKPSFGDEWMIIGLIRSGYMDYWHNRAVVYETSMNNFLSKNSGVVGTKGQAYAADYPAVILAFTSIGKYADKTSSADLVMGVSFDSVVLEGGYINKINALTALKSGNYEVYKEGDLTQQELIDFVLGLQLENGSFQYKGMVDSPVYVTACAVQALSMVNTNETIAQAIEKGADYLSTHIRKDDSLKDIVYTVIALNSAKRTARQVDGNDLIGWVLDYQKENGSFTTDVTEKKGNKQDTSLALLALASQYRFNNNMTNLFDMTDIVGGTHNKLSPGWSAYLNIMKVFGVGMLIFMAFLLVLSRLRIKKWREQGVYNESAGRMMTDAEIAEKQAALAQSNADESLPEEKPEE